VLAISSFYFLGIDVNLRAYVPRATPPAARAMIHCDLAGRLTVIFLPQVFEVLVRPNFPLLIHVQFQPAFRQSVPTSL
jgi:hypothetical protein